MRRVTSRTVLASEPPPGASARRAEYSSASAVLPIRLAALRASRRAMRRTDFCLLTFFVRAPAPRRFPSRHGVCTPCAAGDRLVHVSAIRFGGPHVVRRGGFVAPVVTREGRTSGIPVASFTGTRPLARCAYRMKAAETVVSSLA